MTGAVKEPVSRPILFSAPMVLALLAGTKTQTRRIQRVKVTAEGIESRCPYGVPGDRLWVRETYALSPTWEKSRPAEIPALVGDRSPVWCAATVGDEPSRWGERGKWRPSIHMPRWASRITLEVTGVRVERLQDITEADAHAEGLACLTKDGGHTYKYGIPDRDDWPGNDDHGWHWRDWELCPRQAFRRLWDSANEERRSWASNPWVWAIELKRMAP